MIDYKLIDSQEDIECLDRYDIVCTDHELYKDVMIWGLCKNGELILASRNSEGWPVRVRCSREHMTPSINNQGKVTLEEDIEFKPVSKELGMNLDLDDDLRSVGI